MRAPESILSLLLLVPMATCVTAAAGSSPATVAVAAAALPPLPDAQGFAGMYAGVSGGALLAAGGTNFPDQPFAAGGRKVWHDGVFALEPGASVWRRVGALPRPAGYGVYGTWRDSVVCVGGSDATGHFGEAWQLRWNGHVLTTTPLPRLPIAIANGAGTIVGDIMYVCGGQERPDSTAALARAFALDLGMPDGARGWRELPWPQGAPARILAVAGSHAGALLLASGADLRPGPTGGVERRYLQDAYWYAPKDGWRRCADLPQAVAAAPSPALAVDGIAIVSGVAAPWDSPGGPGVERGYPRQWLGYDARADRWRVVAEAAHGAARLPAVVTAPLVEWEKHFVVISGETAPGVRTPAVTAYAWEGRP